MVSYLRRYTGRLSGWYTPIIRMRERRFRIGGFYSLTLRRVFRLVDKFAPEKTVQCETSGSRVRSRGVY